MQYLQEWRGRDKRKKRAAEESNQESSRKRSRDDAGNDGGRRDSIAIGAVTDSIQTQEFKIRGSAPTPSSNDLLHPSSPFPETKKDNSPSSPLATEPSPSIIHPDRLANISNATPVSTRAPLPDKDKSDYRLSRSPEHINHAGTDEQICKYFLSFLSFEQDDMQSTALNSISLEHASFPSSLPPFYQIDQPTQQSLSIQFHLQISAWTLLAPL